MFFGYFLNIKKVTPSADFVIAPAKAGAFLFSHTRLPFPPRPLLPFGRISPAAKPGWPIIGPTFWSCRAKSGAAFRCAKPPCTVVRFAAMTSSPRTNVLAYPAFASLKRGPSANNPALVAVRLHFAVRNRAGRSLSPPGATCSLPHFRFAQMWPRARTPALVGLRLRFACGETGLAGYQPHRDRSLVALLMLRKRHHRRTPQSGPAKTLFIFVSTRSTVLRAFGGVYGQHHHQAVQCVGAVGNVQHVGVRPVQ